VLSTCPAGAAGLLRTAECALQIMGKAEDRQVDGARLALSAEGGGRMGTDVLIYGAKKP
jgi:acetyl-CoA C-acetyltransferase